MKIHSLTPLLLLAACGGKDAGDDSAAGDDSGPSTVDLVETHITFMPCDTTAADIGLTHVYAESSDGTTRSISANGVPDHSFGDFPNPDADPPANEAVLLENPMDFEAPVSPSGSASEVGGNALVGVATSSVTFHWGAGIYYNNDPRGGWQYELMQSDVFDIDLAVDCNVGHVFPGSPTGAGEGQYHYHGNPYQMTPDTPARTFLGWAADGYPIYGLYDHADGSDTSTAAREMIPSYRLKEGERDGGPGGEYDGTFLADYEYVDGSGDLDACNGRSGAYEVNGDSYDYAYFTTNYFPYMPPCLVASADRSFSLQ